MNASGGSISQTNPSFVDEPGQTSAHLARVRSVAATLLPLWIAVATSLPALVWIGRDRSIWPWDPAWYGEVSVDLWSKLRLSPTEWPGAMATAFGAKPPAIAWLGQFFVPFGNKLGSIETSLLVSVICCEAIAVALVFIAARRFARGGLAAAVVAALLTAAAPLFVSMGHEYFVEPIQSVAVAWALLTMVSAQQWGRSLTIASAVGAAALGLLAKLSSPIYMAIPLAVALGISFTSGRSARRGAWYRDAPLLLTWALTALLSLGCAAWYAKNFAAARAHAEIASQPGLYGVGEPFRTSLQHWFDRYWDVAFLPHFWLAAAAVLLLGYIVGLASGTIDWQYASTQPLLQLLACGSTIVLVLVLFARQPNNEVRYLLPLVPVTALLVGGLFAPLHGRAAGFAWIAAAVFSAAFMFANLQALGATSWPTLTYVPLPAPTRSEFARQLRTIVRETCTPESAGRINMVGTDYPWLNANTLAMLAAEATDLSGRKCYYTSLGYAETNVGNAWDRVQTFAPPYFIALDYGNSENTLPADITRVARFDDAFNRVNVAIYRRVRTSSSFRIVPGSRQAGVVVFRHRS